jgi:putative phosphoesterase
MKVCIVSDSHDNRALLATAVHDAKLRGAEIVLHCGDVIAPTTLRGLTPIGLPVHVIHGNNTGDLVTMHHVMKKFPDIIHYHGMDAVLEFAGRRIFLVHYPHYANAMALTGDYDLVCCGHDHRLIIESVSNIKGGQTLLINPGTVGGVGQPPTYVLGDLANMQFTACDVPADHTVIRNVDPVTPHV